jgi:flagellar basal body-associated protein FliL
MGSARLRIMIIIVFQIIFILAVLGILFFISRKIPVLLEYPRRSKKGDIIYENIRKQLGKAKEKVEASEFLHERVIPRTEKFLRKSKIILLKLDNFLAKRANKLRERIKKRKKIK